jgi:hypothetical protein
MLMILKGTEDEIFPVDDSYLALLHGPPKEARCVFVSCQAVINLANRCRFIQGLKHMGEPESFFVILKWIYKLFGIDANPGAQMSTIPFKAQFP